MKDKLAALEKIKLFVLDMDGTFYLDDQMIEGSLDFLEAVKDEIIFSSLIILPSLPVSTLRDWQE